jgi:gliding motility-associated-like protein
VDITLYPQPQVQITEAHDIDCGIKIGQLVVTGDAQSYQWSPTAGLDNPVSATPVATPVATTQYVVTGTNQYGCTASDSAIIHVFNNGTGLLFAPNAFTPNSDGKNDAFKILIPGEVTGYQLFVYNRYGQLVFQSLNASKGWDGTFNGVPQDMGTYFYTYMAESSTCGAVQGKGDVELIR